MANTIENNDKISVAMAVYEGEKYLPVQLDSILPQLREYDELIISYDAGTDKTLEIIEGYASSDPRIKIYRNTIPGITGNFNNALSHCTGEYIYISDQDDFWLPDKVSTVQQYFRETGADLIIHNGIHTNENLFPSDKPFSEIYRIGNGKIRNILKPRYSGCCMAFTREMLCNILPMPDIQGYDQWIATICEFTGHIEYPREVLLYHRLHSANATPRGKSRPLPTIIKMRSRLIINLIKRLRRIKRNRRN